jgi:hypothetical protein
MAAYSHAGQPDGLRRLLLALAVVTALALAGFAAALLFARGTTEAQPRFLPPMPSASERP